MEVKELAGTYIKCNKKLLFRFLRIIVLKYNNFFWIIVLKYNNCFNIFYLLKK